MNDILCFLDQVRVWLSNPVNFLGAALAFAAFWNAYAAAGQRKFAKKMLLNQYRPRILAIIGEFTFWSTRDAKPTFKFLLRNSGPGPGIVYSQKIFMKSKSEKKWVEKISHVKEELFFPENQNTEEIKFEFIPPSVLNAGHDAKHNFLLLVEIKYKGEEGQKYYYAAIYECKYTNAGMRYVEVILNNESWIKRPKFIE